MVDRENLCPVCGYDLGFPAWDGDSPSDEICPSCGIQFGYNDATGGNTDKRKAIHASWRSEWIKEGMPWRSRATNPPSGWDPVKQLEKLESE